MRTLAELLSVDSLIAVWTYPGTGQFEITESFRCQKRPFGRIILKKSGSRFFIPWTIKGFMAWSLFQQMDSDSCHNLQTWSRATTKTIDLVFLSGRAFTKLPKGPPNDGACSRKPGQRLSIASTQYQTYANDILAATTAVFTVRLPISKLTTCVCLSLSLSTSSAVFCGLWLAGANLQDIARAADAGVRNGSFHN